MRGWLEIMVTTLLTCSWCLCGSCCAPRLATTHKLTDDQSTPFMFGINHMSIMGMVIGRKLLTMFPMLCVCIFWLNTITEGWQTKVLPTDFMFVYEHKKHTHVKKIICCALICTFPCRAAVWSHGCDIQEQANTAVHPHVRDDSNCHQACINQHTNHLKICVYISTAFWYAEGCQDDAIIRYKRVLG